MYNDPSRVQNTQPAQRVLDLLQAGMAELRRVFGTFGAAIARAVRATQHARMKSVLMGMNDAQLEQIGIQRKDISDYAAALVATQDTAL